MAGALVHPLGRARLRGHVAADPGRPRGSGLAGVDAPVADPGRPGRGVPGRRRAGLGPARLPATRAAAARGGRGHHAAARGGRPPRRGRAAGPARHRALHRGRRRRLRLRRSRHRRRHQRAPCARPRRAGPRAGRARPHGGRDGARGIARAARRRGLRHLERGRHGARGPGVPGPGPAVRRLSGARPVRLGGRRAPVRTTARRAGGRRGTAPTARCVERCSRCCGTPPGRCRARR